MVRTVLGAQTRVLWCGPGVKGNVVSISGIELAVDADGPVPESEMALLQDRIDEMPTPRRVELVDVHAVGDAVRNRILEEGVPF